MSGIWSHDKETTPQDQQKFVVPLNRISETLFYDQRMIIDGKVLTEPRAWIISKINRIAANGLVHVTLAQSKFNAHTDYVETDATGNVVGMWADYFKSSPDPIEPEVTPNITYSGPKAELKIGGGYKNFAVDTPQVNGVWKFEIDGEFVPDLVNIIYNTETARKMKVKFLGGDDYIGKVMTIYYTFNDEVVSQLDVGLVAL